VDFVKPLGGAATRRPAVVPLREFWSNYASTAVTAMPPYIFAAPNGFQLMADAMFGGLARHVVINAERLPVNILCTECRNNHSQRQPAACETHLGFLTGALGVLHGLALQATYDPGPEKTCTIAIDLPDTVARCAQTRATVDVQMGDSLALLVDRTFHYVTHVTPLVAAVLELAREKRTLSDLAGTLRVTSGTVAQVLNECYRAGWIIPSHD